MFIRRKEKEQGTKTKGSKRYQVQLLSTRLTKYKYVGILKAITISNMKARKPDHGAYMPIEVHLIKWEACKHVYIHKLG